MKSVFELGPLAFEIFQAVQKLLYYKPYVDGNTGDYPLLFVLINKITHEIEIGTYPDPRFKDEKYCLCPITYLIEPNSDIDIAQWQPSIENIEEFVNEDF